jgi:hypothetical protein
VDGLNFTGAYSGGASYDAHDVATYDGSSWVRISSNGGNVGDTPSLASPFWNPLALKGADGIDGADGLQGEQGIQGPQGEPGTSGGGGTGYPFNPIDRMTTTITTGNKAYMYVVLHPRATVISGFHVYVASGADSIHVGIYRGALRSGNSGNLVLCGESTTGVATSISQASAGLPNFLFCRRAITAVSGQNLSFASGELMTIAFHSNGTTNSYLCSPAVAANQDLAWAMNANYGSTAFPSLVSQAAIQAANLQRLCFELY